MAFFRLAFLFPALTALLLSCTTEIDPKPESPNSVTIQGMVLPNPSSLARSVVQLGNLDRMQSFLQRCETSQTLRIGFIGGSITRGAIASSVETRYSTLFCRWMQEKFPDARFEEVNAGVGATGSRFACSRAKADLLRHQPDFIVIEFAVNDDPRDTLGTAQSFEGLVRQCLNQSDSPVLLLQTMSYGGDSTNQHVQNQIAKYYDLPVISYRNAFWPLVADSIIHWSSLAADAVHPNDQGHFLAARLLSHFVQTASALPRTSTAAAMAPRPPWLTDIFEFADEFHAGDTVLHLTGSLDSVGQAEGTLPPLKTGDTLVIELQGRELTLAFNSSAKSDGRLEISLDGILTESIGNYTTETWSDSIPTFHQVFQKMKKGGHRISIRQISGNPVELTHLLYAP